MLTRSIYKTSYIQKTKRAYDGAVMVWAKAYMVLPDNEIEDYSSRWVLIDVKETIDG